MGIPSRNWVLQGEGRQIWRRISMRWWLALTFAGVAALTGAAVSQISIALTERAFDSRAEELAAGRAVRAASSARAALDRGAGIAQAVHGAEQQWRLLIVAVDDRGRPLVRPDASHASVVRSGLFTEAISAIRGGRRFVGAEPGTGRTFVGLRVDAHRPVALVTVADGSELSGALTAVRDAAHVALLLAVGVGLAAGALAASLIARRLRRLGAAAGAIERGDFATPVRAGFHDEIGQLAATLDVMRGRLGSLFAALDSERERLNRLVRRLHEGVLSIDAAGVVTVANPAAGRLLNSPGVTAGRPLPGEALGDALQRQAMRTRHGGRIEEALRDGPDGRHLKVVSIPAGGTEDEVILVIDDVTAATRRERAEREFVANAAHELRAPLTTISGAVQILLGGAGDDPAARTRFLRHLDRETDRLGRLVRTLLTLARIQTGHELPCLEPVAVAPLLRRVGATVPATPTRVVCVDVDDGLEVPGDPALLEHALLNLVDNASAHTPVGEISLSARRVGAEVRIVIRDTGIGIDPVDQPRVFDRFFRGGDRTGEGFGLGLPIVRDCMAAMGASVAIESGPGGTTATVRIPHDAHHPARVAPIVQEARR